MANELKGFLTYMDYFATGEGLTIEYLFTIAETPEAAKERHLDTFVGKRQEARDYFGATIKVFPIESPEAKNVLDQHFQSAEWIQDQLMKGGIDFHFKYYVNHS